MKNRMFTLVVSLAMVFAVFSVAFVAPQPVYAQSGGGDGTLTASGSGLAGIRGNGTVTISGNGILWILDRAGDADINVSGGGTRADMDNGWIRFAGFNGTAIVSGSQITVALSGYGINLEATGTGSYLLRGSGSYSVEKNGVVITGIWTEEAQIQSIP